MDPPPVHLFLDQWRGEILEAATAALVAARMPHYAAAGPAESRAKLEGLFEQLRAAAATRRLTEPLDYVRALAHERFSAGYDLSEVQTAINLLEEAAWRAAFAHLGPDRYLETLGVVSTILGASKDALAREYVALATNSSAPEPDVQALFAGTDGPWPGGIAPTTA